MKVIVRVPSRRLLLLSPSTPQSRVSATIIIINSPAPCDLVGRLRSRCSFRVLVEDYVYVDFAVFKGGERCRCGVLGSRSGWMAVIDAWCSFGRARLIMSQACSESELAWTAMVSAASVRRTSTLHDQAFKGSVTESAKNI